jgi:hypothetical protein
MISPDWPSHPTELRRLIPYAVLSKDAKVPHFAAFCRILLHFA